MVTEDKRSSPSRMPVVPRADVPHCAPSVWQNLSNALSDVEASVLSKINTAEADILTIVAEQAQLAKESVDAEANVRAAKALLAENGACCAEAGTAIKALRKPFAEAAAASVQLREESREARAQQRIYEEALSFEFSVIQAGNKVFKNGVFEMPDDPKYVRAVMPLLERIGLEQSLLVAFPRMASKSPQMRSDFDVVVLTEVMKQVKAHIEALRSTADAYPPPTLAKHAAALRDAETRLQELEKKRQVVASEAARAEEKTRVFRQEMQEAKLAQGRTEAARDSAQRFLGKFQEGSVAVCRDLGGTLYD